MVAKATWHFKNLNGALTDIGNYDYDPVVDKKRKVKGFIERCVRAFDIFTVRQGTLLKGVVTWIV